MPRDPRLSDPSQYISEVDRKFHKKKKINYQEAFKSKPTEAPFTAGGRFETSDLRNKLQAKKLTQNPRLNFVGGDPTEFQLFTGLPRFDTNRQELYNFETGKPNTIADFRTYPEYNPMWEEMYRVSPTLEPGSAAKSPMPSVRNPDPNNYIMMAQENKAENEIEDNKTVAQIINE